MALSKTLSFSTKVATRRAALSAAYSTARPMLQEFRTEPHSSERLTDASTRRIFNEDHDMFRETCRNFVDNEVMPYHDEWEKQGHVDRELWRKAGSQGLLGVMMPEEYGGAACDAKYAAIEWEEQGYANCSGPGFSLHNEICMPYVLHYGSDAQKDKYLPQMISGDCVSCIAMTEPGAGSDLQGIKTNAVQDAATGDWILNGSKTYITNGLLSDLAIVVAKTDPSAKAAHGTSLFLVDTNLPGFRKGTKLEKMGLKAQDTCELFFDDVRVPADAVLGEVNHGFYYLMNELPQERLLIAIGAISSAEFSFEATRTWCKERNAFGKTLAHLQTVKHTLAEIKTECMVGRTFADRCIELHAEGALDNTMASMAKYWLTDLQNTVTDRCVQLHGGAGFMWEYPICKAHADARVQRIYGGANEIMKELIARGV